MTDQAELDQLAEVEFERLQKQLRQLNGELGLISDEKSVLQKKQINLISVLHREHEKFNSEIISLQQGTHAMKENEYEQNCVEIIQNCMEKRKALEEDKLNLWELEGHIRKIEKEIIALRQNEVTDITYNENVWKTQKVVTKLENRLDVANKKCSDVLTENSTLRECIDHMLQDRTHFNDMWQIMVRQFNEGKKFMMDLIDQSTLAYDQREELCNKLQSLKDKNESDKLLHVQEMRELQRRLEHDAKLQKFYDVKGQRRVNTELEAREANKKLQQRESLEKQLTEYNRIICRMQALFEEDAVARLAFLFTTQEEENFALFNYVNELSHEVELLNEVVQTIVDEIEKQKVNQVENEFKRQTENVVHLMKEKTKRKEKAEDADTKKRSIHEKLKQNLQGIEKVFRLVYWDDVPILSVLGSKNFLTVYNVKLFLGVIEKRINVIASNLNTEESTIKILAKRDRVPKFNVKEHVKVRI